MQEYPCHICNLSFAGLKTAVLRASKKLKNEKEKYHLAASFQKTINEILYKKTKIAMKEFSKNKKNNQNVFVIAGGVAANLSIRKNLTKLSEKEKFISVQVLLFSTIFALQSFVCSGLTTPEKPKSQSYSSPLNFLNTSGFTANGT